MAGPLGVNLAISLGPSTALPGAALRPGQLLQGIVQGAIGELVLTAGGLSIPLEEGTPLRPGQSVTAQVVQNRDTLQLRILPQQPPANSPPTPSAATVTSARPPATASPAGLSGNPSSVTAPVDSLPTPSATPSANPAAAPQVTVPAESLSRIVAAVLASVGSVESPDNAEALLPFNLPVKETVVRTVLSLFVSRDSLAADLSRMATLVREAANANAIPPQTAQALDEVIAATIAPGEKSLHEAVRQAVRNGGKNLEAMLSRLTLSDADPELSQQLETSLRHIVGLLKNSPELARHLSAGGTLAEFDSAAGRILDRLSGTQLQNLHGVNSPYWFIEIPFGADSPIRHAQIHVLSDRRGRRNDSGGSDATVALDLATTRLGDLWISLGIHSGRCVCTFHATSAESVEALRSHAGELAERLSLAGYPGATVHASLWHGNRMLEAANLMRQFAGIDVTA